MEGFAEKESSGCYGRRMVNKGAFPMTGTERIKNKILEDAHAKAADIELQAKREAEEIMDSALKEAAKRKEALLSKAEEEGLEEYRRLVSMAGLEGRREVLKVKQEMVESAFKKAMEKIVKMPDTEYQKFLEEMAVSAATKGTGEIVLAEKDKKRIDRKFIDNINRRLEQAGKSASITLSKDSIRASGGFVLKSGDIEVNSTLEIIFEMIKPVCESEVVKILFS